MESAILRQALDNVLIKWVKSEQMLSDCLTKVLAGAYTRMELTTGMWTLGPDQRAPSTRNRKLQDPASLRTETQEEAEELKAMLVQYVDRMTAEIGISDSVDTFYVEPVTSAAARSMRL